MSFCQCKLKQFTMDLCAWTLTSCHSLPHTVLVFICATYYFRVLSSLLHLLKSVSAHTVDLHITCMSTHWGSLELTQAQGVRQGGWATSLGGGDSVKAGPEGEEPPTREEEEEGGKMQANPAYLPIEMMSYKSRASTSMCQVEVIEEVCSYRCIVCSLASEVCVGHIATLCTYRIMCVFTIVSTSIILVRSYLCTLLWNYPHRHLLLF